MFYTDICVEEQLIKVKRIFMGTDLSLSLELICLMDWVVKNQKNQLNLLVKHAVENGFVRELEKIDGNDHSNVDRLYNSVIEFLTLLERYLIQNLEKYELSENQTNEIIPAIKKLNMENIDLKTLWLSLQQTKVQLNKKQKKLIQIAGATKDTNPNNLVETNPNSTSILFEQILKNWKPTKKEIVN